MSTKFAAKIPLYSLSILLLGYAFYYFGVLNISLVYIAGFALVLNGIGTFLSVYGRNKTVSLFISVYIFNIGLLLLFIEKFHLFLNLPFLLSAFSLITGGAFVIHLLEDSSRILNVLYAIIFFAAGVALLLAFRNFRPFDFLLWIRSIISSFWGLMLFLIFFAGYALLRDKIS